eukprot:3048047-Heterocapsa_arctica.AAC.1
MPLAVWCAVCHQMVLKGHLAMAVFVLVAVSCMLPPARRSNGAEEGGPHPACQDGDLLLEPHGLPRPSAG